MKSVTFKKIVARMGILLLIVTTASLFAISSAAAEGEATLTGSAPLTEGASPAPEAMGEADEESVTIAGAIADFLRDESAGLLSGVTLLFTILVSLSFRKRVIPSLLDALGTDLQRLYLFLQIFLLVGDVLLGRDTDHGTQGLYHVALGDAAIEHDHVAQLVAARGVHDHAITDGKFHAVRGEAVNSAR